MYELDYTPIRLADWNEYFVRFRETGDIKYYNEFLHFYEPILQERVLRFIRRYELEEYRAEDLKQIFSSLLWEELQTYGSGLPPFAVDSVQGAERVARVCASQLRKLSAG